MKLGVHSHRTDNLPQARCPTRIERPPLRCTLVKSRPDVYPSSIPASITDLLLAVSLLPIYAFAHLDRILMLS